MISAPHYLGYHVGIYAGVFGGIFQQLILVAAAMVVIGWASAHYAAVPNRAIVVARWIFGLGAIDFALAHLYGITASAYLVPRYMPFGQEFWVALTGVAFLLAGVAYSLGSSTRSHPGCSR